MKDGWICLMYHNVVADAPGTEKGSYFAISARAFAEHLDRLDDMGLATGSIAAALARPGSRRIAISFDDGDLGQYEFGFRALTARNSSATFFITTSWVGKPGYVSWDHLREMKAAGMSIQSHTHAHRFLSELDRPSALGDLRRAKQDLDYQLEQDTDAVALPGGDFPRRGLRHLLLEAGYRIVATSRWGWNSELTAGGGVPVFVRRCTVRMATTATEFDRVALGNPWLGRRKVLRESVLGATRAALGPTRYSSWRRWLLAAVG